MPLNIIPFLVHISKLHCYRCEQLETVGEIKVTTSHPFPTLPVLLLSFILISWHVKRPTVYSRIVNNHWWWKQNQINDILNPTDPRNWAKITITGFTICELTSDCVWTKNIHDDMIIKINTLWFSSNSIFHKSVEISSWSTRKRLN